MERANHGLRYAYHAAWCLSVYLGSHSMSQHVTACHGMSIGLKGALQAARVLAWTGISILTDAELRQAARADFERRVSGRPYVSPLSPEMKHPLELPEWLTEDALQG